MSNHIVLLCRRYCPGEAWTNRILAYAKGFIELGNNVTIFYLIPDRQRTHYEINLEGCSIINLWERNKGVFRIRPLAYLYNMFLFRRSLNENDVIFNYGYDLYPLLFNKFFLRRWRFFSELTESPLAYSPRFFKTLQVRLYNYLIKSVDGLFVISSSLKDYFIKQNFPSEKLHIINMFVDTNRFQGLKKNDTRPYIAYCGTIALKKDAVDLLIESFKIFHKQYPSFYLYLIGNFGSERDKAVVGQLIRENELQDSVVLTGPIEPTQMPQILIDAKILALARPRNLQTENGFPTKLGEYLATGNPVVVSDVGEIAKYIHHNENGYLVEVDNVIDFANQLIWIVNHYNEAQKVGLKGRQLSETEFSYLSQAEKALKVMFQ